MADFVPETIIETKRLILRTEAKGDYASWLEHMNTTNIRRYLGGLETPEAIRVTFDRMSDSQREDGFSFWFVEHKADKTLIGCCGLKRVNAETAPEEIQGDMEIGWIIREDYWRQGYATEAACASLRHGFANFDTRHIVALTSDSNLASWRMMEKMGMQRHDDWQFHDPDFPDSDNPTIVYAITRDQWSEI